MKTNLSERILVSIKEADSSLQPVDSMCGFIGDLFKNMSEDFKSNSESLYDWCEGGDTFRNAGFEEDKCKVLDKMLGEINPLVQSINGVLYHYAGEDLNEGTTNRKVSKAWSEDGNSLNIREMVARSLEDEDSSSNITDEEVDKVAGCVLDDDEFMSKLEDLIRNATLKAAGKDNK